MRAEGGQIESLLTIISQSRRLLVELYDSYFSGRPLPYKDALLLLSDDNQRFQALLSHGLLEIGSEGVRLNPDWKLFLKKTCEGKSIFDFDSLEKKLNEIEEALSQEANAVPIEEIILKLRIIHEEWFNLFKPEQRGENLENKKIKELQGRWEHIVWLDLKKFWGLRESWDSFIIDIWEEANFLKSKFQEFYSNDLNNKNRLPDFIRNLLEKRSESEEKLKQNIYQVLEEEQTLFWHPSVSRTTRILPAYFEGGEGKLSAKRIKGRKKINLKKQKKPQIDLEIISDDYAQADLSEIMESFWGGDHDLADHIAKHPKTKNLDGGRQRDLFFKCLFRYRDRLIRLSTKKKKNQELWVEKKD